MPKPENNYKSILNILCIVTISRGSYTYIAYKGNISDGLKYIETYRNRPRLSRKDNRAVATLWTKIDQVRELESVQGIR